MGNSDASVPRLAEVKAALPNVPIARKPMLLLGLAVLVSFLRHGRTLAYPSIAAHQLRNINVTLSLPNQTDRLVLLSDYMHGVQQITMFMNKPVGSLESKWIKYGLVPLADYLSGTNFDFCSLPSNETFCYLSAKVKESSRQSVSLPFWVPRNGSFGWGLEQRRKNLVLEVHLSRSHVQQGVDSRNMLQ